MQMIKSLLSAMTLVAISFFMTSSAYASVDNVSDYSFSLSQSTDSGEETKKPAEGDEEPDC